MNSSVSLWIAASLLTIATAYFQRVTGPSYPVRGTVIFKEATIQYDLPRSHDCGSPALMHLKVFDTTIVGNVEWKRYKTEDAWNRTPLSYTKGSLVAELPSQPPAGKLQYRLVLNRGDEVAVVPGVESIIIRFKGEVPLPVLIAHIVAMFAAMLLAARSGLEYFSKESGLRSLTNWTLALTVVGGFILGPIVQRYAFNDWWTGWPSGTDLTDNKTTVMLIAWVGVAIAVRKSRKPRAWALAASIVTFIVFLIPHSLFGSELNQTALEKLNPKTDSVQIR